MNDTSAILHAVEQVRDEAREHRKLTDQHAIELSALAETARAHATTLRHLGGEVASLGTQFAKMADAQISVAKASAVASEMAAQALAKANTTHDDTRKMVESAMSIQREAIAGAVKEALAPVVAEIDGLKKSDAAQSEQNATIISMLAKFTRWQDHWAFKVAIVVSGLVGAVAAGYFGAH